MNAPFSVSLGVAERDVDDDTAAALDLLDAVAAFTGEPPAALLRRVFVGALAQGVGADDHSSSDGPPTLPPPREVRPHLTPPDGVDPSSEPLRVFMTYRKQRAEGRFWPATLALAVDTGPDSAIGVTYTSPSKAANAVVAGWNPDRQSPTSGWFAWHLIDTGQRLRSLRFPRVSPPPHPAPPVEPLPEPSPQEPQHASA